jgi:Arm DNA-binding domain
MPVRMTETAISKAIREVANGTRRDLADSGCPGLRLRLTSGGRATWVLACRDRHGRMRRFPLGRYPAIGISDARTKARELHTRVRQEGADPIADRRRDRAIGAAAKVGEGTLSALLALYGWVMLTFGCHDAWVAATATRRFASRAGCGLGRITSGTRSACWRNL